ncbi:MAG TPA: efflux RND transporter periplasmic adaptor subunit [Candidatus Baltobacteraceae bacterium]|nr:efflux RND transporter periplasmic adaptor subunit [Candidatus Baltobacteraceae bacterium]
MTVRRSLTAAGLAVVMLAGCGGPKQQRGPMALDVDVAQAQRRDIATYLTLDGQIAPLQDATLSFQQSGPITQMYVNQGDRVSAGQLLARIDASTLQSQLGQVQAQIAQSAAQAQSSALNVPITQANTSQAVQSARAALANAQLTYNQNQTLFKQGYVSQSQLEQSRAAYVAAQTQYQTAIANRGTTGVQNAQAQAAREAVSAMEAQANTLRTQIGQTSLYAPFDGVVTARLMDPGAMASPGNPVLRLSQVDTVWVNVNVPDEDLAFVHSGTPVTFTSSQIANRKFEGRIDTVNATPTQGTLSYQARIRQANPGDLLRGGMLVSVTVQKQMHRNAIVVPRAAVAQTDQGANVFIVEPADNAGTGGGASGANATGGGGAGPAAGGPQYKAVMVPVTIGIQTDTLSEVSGPKLRPGSMVITTRPDALQDGSPVAVVGGRHGQ